MFGADGPPVDFFDAALQTSTTLIAGTPIKEGVPRLGEKPCCKSRGLAEIDDRRFDTDYCDVFA